MVFHENEFLFSTSYTHILDVWSASLDTGVPSSSMLDDWQAHSFDPPGNTDPVGAASPSLSPTGPAAALPSLRVADESQVASFGPSASTGPRENAALEDPS